MRPYARIARLAQAIAAACGARFGQLGEAANASAAILGGAVPSGGGLNARAMVEQPRKAYLLLNVEPSLDHGDAGAGACARAGARPSR